MLPLHGMRIVALEHAVAAPLCTRQLADMGAEVVKIERPNDGDFARAYDGFVRGLSSFFIWLNRGKRSLTLDIKHELGRGVLERLVGRADVLVQNLAPGATARLGLDYAALAERFPRLIVCDMSGYGEGGPFAEKKAYDLLIQAELGLMSVTGTPDQPARVGISAADIATGMYAHAGVLAALFRREREGTGCNVKVAMLDALAEWMTYPMYRVAYADSPLPRSPTSHPALAPYGAHRTGDGEVIFGLQNEREWATFCVKVMRRPEWIDDPRFHVNSARCRNREALTALIEAEFAQKTSMEVVAILDAAGIANGRLNDARALWSHEQLSARDRWRDVATEAGPVRALLPPVIFGDSEAPMGEVPALGQHTDTILGELGYSPGDVEKMRSAGAV